MFRVAACIAIAAGLASACLHDDLVPCGNHLCPVGDVCTSAGVCADHASAAACDGKADLEACTIAGKDGTCWQGACHEVACGNGIVDQGEVCDDGNNVLDDGCSADCRSDETCGNGIVDPVRFEQCDSGVPGQGADGCSSTCTLEVEIWRDVSPSGIDVVSDVALVFDTARGVSVLLGGFGSAFDGVTWEWNGISWRARRPEVVPSFRQGVGAAYDLARHRTVIFGGHNVFGGKDGDTWEWDGVQWVERMPAVSPPARTNAAMAYDPVRNRVVLFGGAGDTLLADTWEWDGTSWTQRQIAGPSARQGARLTFDPSTGKLVLFGGLGATTLADTWTFDGTTWALLNPATKPPARWLAAMATCGNQVVLQGGATAAFGSALGDSWTWNGATWTQFAIAGPAPAARSGSAFAYDSIRDRCTLYGGDDGSTTYGDTWELAGTTWAQVPFEAKPRARSDHGLAYDPLRGRIVLFAGRVSGAASQDTWEWDGLNWLQQKPPSSPPARITASLVYDERLRQVVVFGGGATTPASNDLWGWDGARWAQLPAASSPPGRQSLGLAYDRDRDRIVMFGGSVTGTVFGDTWEWDGSTWLELTPATGPSPRASATLVYDPIRHHTVLVGGLDGAGFQSDAWEWDGTTWTQVSTSLPWPASRIGATYDLARKHLVGFGGSSYFGSTTDASFEYDLMIETRTPVISPEARGTPLAYDYIAHRALLFAGVGTNKSALDDTWVRNFEAPTSPPEACIHAEADTDGDKLAGCADPDCRGRCNPLCPPGVTCAPSTPHCGDGACGAVEDYLICPSDCAPP